MELRTTRQMRRNEQLSKTMAKRAETADAPAQSKPAQPQPPADKLSVSRQALAWLEEQNRKMWEQEEKMWRQEEKIREQEEMWRDEEKMQEQGTARQKGFAVFTVKK